MIRKRDLVTAIILTFVTCGIYGIIWFVEITDDARAASNDQSLPSGGTAFLLSLVTCGIYSFIWAYKMGKAINQARVNRGMVDNDKSVLYLVLNLFGLGIVATAFMQNDLNEIAEQA